MISTTSELDDVEIELADEGARVVDRMTDGLGLWTDRTEAALFLASVAVARDEAPIPEDQLGDERESLGLLLEASIDPDEDHLALFSIAKTPERPPAAVLDEHLTGWIEAGAKIVGPRLQGTAPEATRSVRELIGEIV